MPAKKKKVVSKKTKVKVEEIGLQLSRSDIEYVLKHTELDIGQLAADLGLPIAKAKELEVYIQSLPKDGSLIDPIKLDPKSVVLGPISKEEEQHIFNVKPRLRPDVTFFDSKFPNEK